MSDRWTHPHTRWYTGSAVPERRSRRGAISRDRAPPVAARLTCLGEPPAHGGPGDRPNHPCLAGVDRPRRASVRGRRVRRRDPDPSGQLARPRAARDGVCRRLHRGELAAAARRPPPRDRAHDSRARPTVRDGLRRHRHWFLAEPSGVHNRDRRARDAAALHASPALLLLGLLPHALPELVALFLPLAAWIVASRRGEWERLLAATIVTVSLAVPTLVLAAAWEVYVAPHILAAMFGSR